MLLGCRRHLLVCRIDHGHRLVHRHLLVRRCTPAVKAQLEPIPGHGLDMSFEEPWSELLNALLDRPSNSLAALVINGESNVKNEWKRG